MFYKRLEPLFKLTAREEDTVLTRCANHADIYAQPHDLPFVSSAWMRLAQANHIAHSDVQYHQKYYIWKAASRQNKG